MIEFKSKNLTENNYYQKTPKIIIIIIQNSKSASPSYPWGPPWSVVGRLVKYWLSQKELYLVFPLLSSFVFRLVSSFLAAASCLSAGKSDDNNFTVNPERCLLILKIFFFTSSSLKDLATLQTVQEKKRNRLRLMKPRSFLQAPKTE